MSGLGKIADSYAAQREREWRQRGSSTRDVLLSRTTGMDPRDIAAFREFSSARRLLIVIRCPKPQARLWHGSFPAKSWATKTKTDEFGLVTSGSGHIMVSDYDLMSLWRVSGKAYRKVVVTAATPGADRGAFSPEARDLIRALNGQLISKIQHGCQDDWQSPKNPGVKDEDRFAAAEQGNFHVLVDRSACARFYAEHGLGWPYGPSGRFLVGL